MSVISSTTSEKDRERGGGTVSVRDDSSSATPFVSPARATVKYGTDGVQFTTFVVPSETQPSAKSAVTGPESARSMW